MIRKPIPRLIDERADIDVAESTNSYVAKVLADAKRVTMGLKQKFKHIIGDVAELDVESIVNAGKPSQGIVADTPATASMIKFYLLGCPHDKQTENDYGTQNYVTYKVIDVLSVEAGTTFGELKSIITSKGYNIEDLGIYNVDTNMSNGSHGFIYQDNMSNTIVGVQPGFSIKPSTKKGDIIDSRDYVIEGEGYDYWRESSWSNVKNGYYQSSAWNGYQHCDEYGYFTDDIIVEEGIAFILPKEDR